MHWKRLIGLPNNSRHAERSEARCSTGKAITNDVQNPVSRRSKWQLSTVKATGVEDDLGTLTQGKYADFVAISMDEIEAQPIFSAPYLVYSCHRELVTDVWVGGRHIMENRKLEDLNQRIVEKSRKWAEKIGAFETNSSLKWRTKLQSSLLIYSLTLSFDLHILFSLRN